MQPSSILYVQQAKYFHIKTSGSESQGQEEAACASSGLCDHYSESFIWMATLKVQNAVTKCL